MSRASDWVRLFEISLSPETRLGALRGARRDGVAAEVLAALRISTALDLFEALHRPPNDKETQA